MSAYVTNSIAMTVTGAVATTSTVVARVPFTARVRGITVAVGTAPVGSTLNGTVTKKTGAAAAVVVGTWSIAAGATSAVATLAAGATTDMLAADDLLQLVVAAVGSSTAGSNLTAFVTWDSSADQNGVNVHSNTVHRGGHAGSVVS